MTQANFERRVTTTDVFIHPKLLSWFNHRILHCYIDVGKICFVWSTECTCFTMTSAKVQNSLLRLFATTVAKSFASSLIRFMYFPFILLLGNFIYYHKMVEEKKKRKLNWTLTKTCQTMLLGLQIFTKNIATLPISNFNFFYCASNIARNIEVVQQYLCH